MSRTTSTVFPDAFEVVKTLTQRTRQAATDNEKLAADYLISLAKKCGYKAYKHAFDITVSCQGKATITVGKKRFTGFPFGLCGNSVTKAPLIFCENPRAVNLAPEHFRGKILLTYGRPRDLYGELKDSGIAGMISFGAPEKPTLSLSHRQYEVNPLPATTLTHEDAVELSQFSGHDVTLKIEHDVQTRKAHNVIVDIPGSNPDGTLTHFVGHYDTVEHSPGAADNAGGCAVLAELMHDMKTTFKPTRDVRFVFFSGEELGLIGSQAYCRDYAEEIQKKGRLVVNIDVTGDDLGFDVLCVTGTHELAGLAQGLARSKGYYCNTNLGIYSSDSVPFARLGVPSVNVARYGGKCSMKGHTVDDKIEYITPRGLQQTLEATRAWIGPFVNGALYPTDKRIDESLRDELEKYLYGLTGAAPELLWPPKYKG